MSLYKYFRREGPLLPTSSTVFYSFLTKKGLDAANKEVRSSLEDKKTRGKYNSYSPEEGAKIGKYAVENGAIRASRHFSKRFDRSISESTVRRFEAEYLQALARKRETKDPTVKMLPMKSQGRPLLLGKELDESMQEYIKATRVARGVVNTAIVMAAAMGIVSLSDFMKLKSHGGHIEVMDEVASESNGVY